MSGGLDDLKTHLVSAPQGKPGVSHIRSCSITGSLIRYLRPATLVLGLALGIVAIQAGWSHLFEWRSLGENYKAYYALKAFFGLVLLGTVAFAFAERKYAGLHLLAIAATAFTLALVQFGGLATESILCTTPT